MKSNIIGAQKVVDTSFNKNEADSNEIDEEISKYLAEKTKTSTDRSLIATALANNLICSALKPAEVDSLTEELKYYYFSENEILCRQGSIGCHFFIVSSGVFDVIINDNVVNTMKKGIAFGELALMYNTPRTATVKCIKNGGIWAMHRNAFRDFLKESSKQNFVENRAFLDSVRIFDMLTEAQKRMIVNSFIVQNFEAHNVIVNKGEKGDVLYIIKEGIAEVWIDNKIVRELNKGDYFGERALLYDEPRSATIVAASRLICVSLARGTLQNILGNLQHVLFQNLITISLQNSSVFQQFTNDQLSGLVKSVIVKEYPDNYTILDRETRSKGVRYIIVLEGELLISLDGKKVCRLSRGGSFGGDYVLKPKNPFMHRVDSITSCKLALLTNNAIAATLDTLDINQTLDNNNKKNIIRKMYIFRCLSPNQINLLVESFKTCDYLEKQVVFREGDDGSKFYIIREGEFSIMKNSKRLRTLGKHDYFGERALIYKEPRSATVICISSFASLWIVDKNFFLKIVEGPMLEYIEQRIRLQDTNVNFEDLMVLKIVGRGTFGIVKKVRHKKTDTKFALKCISRKAIVKYKQQEHIMLEREIMAENDHPLILKLVRTFKDQKYVYFLMELCTGGELYSAIRKLGLLSKEQSQFYLASIILAIEYLHERNIVFRDLKPENVLLDSQGYIKLIDFGCAKKVKDRTYTLMGTPHYMAPEIILGKGYSTFADIWTFGIILYEFLCGPLPFGNDAEDQLEIFRDILIGELAFPDYVTDPGSINLIKKFLCRVPEVRLGCGLRGYEDIKQHDFFQDFDWDKLEGRNLVPPLIPDREVYAENEADVEVEEKDSEENLLNLKDQDTPGWDAEF